MTKLNPRRSPAASVPDVAPEQKLNPGEELIPDEPTPDYRAELIETLAELATWEATLDDSAPVQATLARIKAVVRDV